MTTKIVGSFISSLLRTVHLGMKLFGTRKWLMGGCGLLVLAATFVFWPYIFCYDSVCSQCGAIKQTTEWHLPNSDYSFTHSSIEQTPLSTYLTSAGIVGAHSHHWLFGHGGGNGIRCALGDGDQIRATVESPEVVRFLALGRQFGDPEENSNFLRYAFDRDISRGVCFIARSVPTNGFATREQYRAWMAEYDFLIKDAIEYSKSIRAEQK